MSKPYDAHFSQLPECLKDTYKGVSGYIYSAENVANSGFNIQIPDAVAADKPVTVSGCEYVPDAYEAILTAEKQGLVRIVRYSDASEKTLAWLERTVREEYKNAFDRPDYRFFLEGKFGNLLK